MPGSRALMRASVRRMAASRAGVSSSPSSSSLSSDSESESPASKSSMSASEPYFSSTFKHEGTRKKEKKKKGQRDGDACVTDKNVVAYA